MYFAHIYMPINNSRMVIQTTLDTPCSLWVITGTYSENCFGKKSWFAGRVLIETTFLTAEDPLHVWVVNKDGSFLYVLYQKENKFPIKYCYQGTLDVVCYRWALGGHYTPHLARTVEQLYFSSSCCCFLCRSSQIRRKYNLAEHTLH